MIYGAGMKLVMDIYEEWDGTDRIGKGLLLVVGVLILLVLLLIPFLIWLAFQPVHIPVEHLGNTCKQYYEVVTTKGITNYVPVNVCP